MGFAADPRFLVTVEGGMGWIGVIAVPPSLSRLRGHSPGLIESEFFDYLDGTFTGARCKGHLGKVFPDEIGKMPLELQMHLLSDAPRNSFAA